MQSAFPQMDADMWKCHHDCSTDLWFRASCQQEMPSCYLYSFKRSEKTAETWKQKKGKRCGPAFGNLAKNKKPADSSKLLSPTTGNSFQNCQEQDDIHFALQNCSRASARCSLGLGRIGEKRCQHPREEYPEAPRASQGPGSTLKPEQSSLFARAGQATSSVWQSKMVFLSLLLSYINRKDRVWVLHSLLGVASSSDSSWSSK